ncbi:hypothetical protein [Tenacibaculum sp. 190524A02b]|uniref:hypothetical protein n=1 Tax=Tenacibaculum vairaonense TaxID=3137860 RepID=UPI0031FB253D
MKHYLIIVGVLLLSLNQSIAQCFSGGGINNYNNLSKTTGNTTLDAQFNQEKGLIENVFKVSVDLWIMDDGNSPNALANCQSRNPRVYDGTVRFGKNLMVNELYTMTKGGYAVAGILAHEFAHILQCKKNSAFRARDRELQADFLAGFYIGRKSYLYNTNIKNFANSLFDAGDWYDPSHHGTPVERVNSMVAGFKSRNESVETAYLNSITYINNGKRTILTGLDRARIKRKVACTHKVTCTHKTTCKHTMACQHKIACQHKKACQHRMVCQHIVQTIYGPRRSHQYDLQHPFDIQHQYDLQHAFDYKHRFDYQHTFDFKHQYDYTY